MLGHRDDVMDLLDAADVLVHPSSIDAFPTALIEAMAASVPVVATNVGGIPEIVMAGETGQLVGAPPDATSWRMRSSRCWPIRSCVDAWEGGQGALRARVHPRDLGAPDARSL